VASQLCWSLGWLFLLLGQFDRFATGWLVGWVNLAGTAICYVGYLAIFDWFAIGWLAGWVGLWPV